MLKLGIIGSSPGNGHPYSWSAIFNGYDQVAMSSCPFPVIPQYLAERRFPEDFLPDGKVTHIWTQDPENSVHIAAATRIPHVVGDFRTMIGEVDAILLARDDAELHEEFAIPFLQAGLPVYLDKPFVHDHATAKRILAEERFPGQLFSCTPLIYAPELMLTDADRTTLGKVRHVNAVTPKYWETYAVHIIEPTLIYLGVTQTPEDVTVTGTGDVSIVSASWAEGVSASFTVTGKIPARIAFDIFGETGHQHRVFVDSFTAFKSALKAFCDGVLTRQRMYDPTRLSIVTGLIETGLKNNIGKH